MAGLSNAISLYGPRADLASITIKYYGSLANLPRPVEYFEQYVNDPQYFKDQKKTAFTTGSATSAITVQGSPSYYVILAGYNEHFYEIIYYPRYDQTLAQLKAIVATFEFTN
ncbi:MAG: hypothetical protein A3H72_01250 [Candidatus Doudnabacteria bacterium RIFCSPLOWO2_02_FULL_48_8]|uniref:Uncharacterized protein n=1 Tax=Candidatus Doudnabacteria bacterium RIFCSPHIGHO2_01_FULL_46_24 TaxID=1817825 RepID=A0A1F5NUV3_9BACT|nr:MAG: hypothetical protein A2720_02800 [Candidatus Doudnabacteria bacterium RIFCSPHIGHO2_01_FULL_46_24]OGE95024.1 MAG: hypothetical protein A3H72_01250 [Candidatus Doudnabacteria bacterium RIFCSPLOWO2_02_FULL_48_8]OGE95936.1 MAG: hypothetical protein A3E98_00615 [Candidatus Doudnabacteria bacterium RIFCSPHIGHO2_12_FULL_48_11]